MAQANSKALQAQTADIKTVAVAKNGKPIPKRILALRAILDQGDDLNEQQAAELQAWATKHLPPGKRTLFAVPSFIMATGYKPPREPEPEPKPKRPDFYGEAKSTLISAGGSLGDAIGNAEAYAAFLQDYFAQDGGDGAGGRLPMGRYMAVRILAETLGELSEIESKRAAWEARDNA